MRIDRLPAVPLIASDPYISVWMPSDSMCVSDTIHWCGPLKPIRGTMTVDGKTASQSFSCHADCQSASRFRINRAVNRHPFTIKSQGEITTGDGKNRRLGKFHDTACQGQLQNSCMVVIISHQNIGRRQRIHISRTAFAVALGLTSLTAAVLYRGKRPRGNNLYHTPAPFSRRSFSFRSASAAAILSYSALSIATNFIISPAL